MNTITISRLEYIYFAGSIRSVSMRSFLWAREIYFEPFNLSYNVIIPNFEDIGSIEFEFSKINNQLVYFEKKTLANVLNSNSKTYDYDKFIDFVVGNTCKYVSSFSNCNSTIINKGLGPSILELAHDLEYLKTIRFNGYSIINWLEKNAYYIENVMTFQKALYKSVTNGFIDYFNNIIEIICFLSGGLSLLFSIFLIRPEIQKIKLNLLSKNEILTILQNSSEDCTSIEESKESWLN